jgi:ribonuclease P protein component
MLPKEQRLTTKDVALVFTGKRKTIHTQYFNVITAQPTGLKHKKYAALVTKKVAPSAVLRNKMRRRVYRCIQKNILKSTPPRAIVVQVNHVFF